MQRIVHITLSFEDFHEKVFAWWFKNVPKISHFGPKIHYFSLKFHENLQKSHLNVLQLTISYQDVIKPCLGSLEVFLKRYEIFFQILFSVRLSAALSKGLPVSKFTVAGAEIGPNRLTDQKILIFQSQRYRCPNPTIEEET